MFVIFNSNLIPVKIIYHNLYICIFIPVALFILPLLTTILISINTPLALKNFRPNNLIFPYTMLIQHHTIFYFSLLYMTVMHYQDYILN